MSNPIPPLLYVDEQYTSGQFNNNVKVYGNFTIQNTSDSTAQGTGAVVIEGGLYVNKSVIIGSTNVSTDTSSGALVISGGLGLSGSINANNATFIEYISCGTNISINNNGYGIRVKEGLNAKQGLVTLPTSTGHYVVNNTSVTSLSRIFLTTNNTAGTVGYVVVSSRIPGTSFTIQSSSINDGSDIAYEIFEPV